MVINFIYLFFYRSYLLLLSEFNRLKLVKMSNYFIFYFYILNYNVLKINVTYNIQEK